jgi:hypothetical protein
MLAHFEIYKLILGLPGDIFELGVLKGASLIRWATFRTMLENDTSRAIVGFDAFGPFPINGLSMAQDVEFIKKFEGRLAKDCPSRSSRLSLRPRASKISS